MSMDPETVRKVAHLARIAVSDAEIPALAEELGSILGWVEQLQAIDVEGVEPMSSVNDIPLPQRADEIADGAIREKVLANAPDAREGFFAVPKVVE